MKLWKVAIEKYADGTKKAAVLGCKIYKGKGPRNTIKTLPGMTAYNMWYNSEETATEVVNRVNGGV